MRSSGYFNNCYCNYLVFSALNTKKKFVFQDYKMPTIEEILQTKNEKYPSNWENLNKVFLENLGIRIP